MKTTVRILLFLAMGLGVLTPARAQEYTHDLGNDANLTIEFAVSQSDVVIEGHDSDEVVIRNLDYDAPPERAQGLTAIYGGAEDNTGIGLAVTREGNTLKITQASRDGGDFRLMIPNRVRIMVEEVNWGGGDVEIRNHDGEIEIASKSGDMTLTNVTGPITANSTSGDLEIVFSELSQRNPTSISLVSGFIDVTLPAGSPANFHLSSVSGEIYTNLDLQVEGEEGREGMRLFGTRSMKATLGGGGVEVSLKSISGDIYLRGAGQ